jgi:hypothetical protein
MMADDEKRVDDKATLRPDLQGVKESVLNLVDGSGRIALVEAQVQRGLHAARCASDPLSDIAALERLSRSVMKLHHAQMKGQVNLYASTLLRLRSAARAL